MTLPSQKIGRTDLSVSTLGLGGTSLGNMYAAVDADHAVDLVRASHSAGVTLFDTAPCYGVGLSEQRLGKVLPSLPRESFVLSTKVGYKLVPLADGEENPSLFIDTPRCRAIYDFSYDGAMRSIEGSLSRLGLDRVDMVAIHDPDETVGIDPAADPYAKSHFGEAMEGAYLALDSLRSQGVIKAIGVGMNQWRMLVDFVEQGDFDYVLVAGRYTLLQYDAAPTLTDACLRKKVSIIAGGPYSSGILASGAVPGAYFNYAPANEDVLNHVRRIEALCATHGVSLGAAALHFPLQHPTVASVIPGARSIEELDSNLAMMAEIVPETFWQALVSEGLLPAELMSSAT